MENAAVDWGVGADARPVLFGFEGQSDAIATRSSDCTIKAPLKARAAMSAPGIALFEIYGR